MEIIFKLFKNYFAVFDKTKFEFKKYPNITKKYRKLCKKKVEKNIENNEGENSIIKNILNDILKFNYKIKKKDLVNFCLDYLSIKKNFILCNIPNIQTIQEKNKQKIFLDEKYLNLIEQKKINQNINLICIIDKHKYSEKIVNISYPYINSLLFTMFNSIQFNEEFMFDNLPISEIYILFKKYIETIKNKENIKSISFGNEFLLNKNSFLSYNDEYYQSFISYLIDQFLQDYKIEKKIFGKINLDEIELNDDKLDNYYEKFKIIFGFNKMFPNLKKKKLMEIKYEEINKANNIIKLPTNDLKIIIFDFNSAPIVDDYNTVCQNINNFIKNKNKIEIISFYNFQINNIETIDNIYNFIIKNFPNLKEFFINNNIPIAKLTNSNLLKMKNNSYKKFLYIGYDINNNIIYYRKGINKIQSIDLLDLFNIFNNQIIKLSLIHENIDIIYNKDKTELKILNLSKNNNKEDKAKHSADYYYFPLMNLSDFIYQQKNLEILDINGFGFTFEEAKNNNIKNLYINYFEEEKCNELFEYKYTNLNKSYKPNRIIIEQDINLKNNFPNLQEINIGNIGKNCDLFSKIRNNTNKDIKMNFKK